MELSRRSVLAGGLGVSALTLGSPLGLAPASAAPQPKTGYVWPAGQVFPSFAKAKRLVVADLRGLDGQERLLLTTLQGIVNRHVPEIYLIADEVDRTWLGNLPVKQTQLSDPLSLVDRYRHRISGAVVLDPKVPDTVNLATTIAGLEGAVVASAEQVERHGLKVVDDLRGRFADDPAAVHEWAMANLWHRCNHRALVGLPPVQKVDVEGVTWTEVLRAPVGVHDRSNQKVYELDLTEHLDGAELYVRFADSDPKDGWGASLRGLQLAVDGTVTVDLLPNTPEEEAVLHDAGNSQVGGSGNRFADGGNSFVYRFEIPTGARKVVLSAMLENEFLVQVATKAPTRVEPFAQFRDFAVATKSFVSWLPPSGASGSQFSELLSKVEPGTVYAGWFANDVSGEWSGVALCSSHAVEVVAADFYANATVLSGVLAKTSAKPTKRRSLKPSHPVYLTLVIGEGDNIQYCQRRMREIWDDPGRGSVPMNWTISPLLADIGPALLNHYQRTATANDFFVCGPSGAGYAYPDTWPAESLDVYTSMTGRYLKATGLDVVYGYSTPIEGQPHPRIPDRVLASHERYADLRGYIQLDERGRFIDPTAPVPLIGTLWPMGLASDYAKGIEAYIEAMGGATVESPLFIAGLINAWQWTPTDIKELVDSLPSTVKVVLADEFFDRFATTKPRPATPAANKLRHTQRSAADRASSEPSASGR